MFQQIINDIKRQFKSGTMLMKLIIVNAAVFIGFGVFKVLAFLMKWDSFYAWQMAPNGKAYKILKAEQWLATTPDLEVLMYKPWTIFTYMFMHADGWHLFSNLLVLYFSGLIFSMYLDSKKMLRTFILGGLAGSVLFIIAYNAFPLLQEYKNATMVGASASVMAIFVGIATYMPNMEVKLFFMIRVKLKWLAVAYVLFDFMSIQSGVNMGGHIAHLGGAIYGFIAMSQLRQGKDISKWLQPIIDFFQNPFKRKPRMKVVYTRDGGGTKTKKKPPRNDYDYNESKVEKQKKVDTILDKIKVGGYESLSKQEKKFLHDFSNEV
jgi:membrane associated rhomboid family serine protease